ncbi:Co2+/Mg2+ efflux protein ApaG [Neolewinella litorea]|uniref:Co2+/Mg2+ efflux protein ApaG n=1 Tax=Neolewinella litorea TaxID=2562452 RepID=A0A4V3XKN7_9BACT|nr:Co2+/Mg2+ efflux protein ApaG [Neolewinella litorea]THH37663.1 Co2+/Mg2+ efflux protein ApaG [Neolewinella litorea]
MTSQTTQRIRVSAQSFYQERYSQPQEGQYVHAYRIRIENNSALPIQLLSRSWEVIDATGFRRHVEGDGVVGQQPVIPPGESYEYNSWVQFETPIGAMEGSYVMFRERDGVENYFHVKVPRFLHIAPAILN